MAKKKSRKSKSSKKISNDEFHKLQYSEQSSQKKHKNSKQYRSSDNNQSNSRNTNFNNNDVEYCIPTETVEILNLKNTNEIVKIDNPNIFFNRCMSKNTTSKSANKQGHLRNMNNICHSKYLTKMMSNLENRQDEIINNLKNSGYCVKSYKMKNDYRIVIGLGGAHVLETNMLLHHIYGIPYIPGSALKGLAKAAAVENIREYINSNDLTESIKQKNESLLKKLFKKRMEKEKISINDIENHIIITKLVSHILESEDSLKCKEGNVLKDIETYKKIFGTQKSKGRAIFFDAYPIGNINMKLDVMTPHFPDYYGEMESKTPKTYPTDYQSPNPIVFLVLSNQEFKFNIGIKLYDEDYDSNGAPIVDNNKLLENTTELLKYGLSELGIGAKTSIGYGYFE